MKIKNWKLKLNTWIPVKLQLGGTALFIIAVALIIGYQSTAFTGFPKGYDSFGHLSLVKIIRDNFPQVFWNAHWYGGQPIFYRAYPPAYHFLLAALGGFTSIPNLMLGMAAVNISTTALLIFFIIYLLAKKILPGLLAALFYLSSSVVWTYLLLDGLYPRTFAQMTFALAVLILLFYLKRMKSPALNYGTSILIKTSTDNVNWLYYLVVLSFSLAFLSHFLAAVLLILAFFLLLLVLFPRFDDRVVLAVKILVPVAGLVAFFYLPLFLTGQGETSLWGAFEGGNYLPLSFAGLFRQSYPGLPFLSIPLFLFLSAVVFLTRSHLPPSGGEGESSNRRIFVEKIFWVFGLLSLLSFFYVLGTFGFYFSGVYPSQLLLTAGFFLSIFTGLGFSLLLEKGILGRRLLLVVIVGFLGLSLAQIPSLKKIRSDQSLVWPQLSFKTLASDRSFRFAHRSDILGGAFNFYSQTLQEGGYWGQGIVHRRFFSWFEEAVFGQNNNPEETAFLLDWYGVKSFYTGKLTKEGKAFSPEAKLLADGENFISVGSSEWVYKKASPILQARQTPVVWVKGEEEKYQKLLEVLAQKGWNSQKVIFLRLKAGEKLKSEKGQIVVSVVSEIEEALRQATTSANLQEAVGEQKAQFVSSQRREIEFNEGFNGVLFKESYFPNWTARLGKMERLKIYQAGPGMMYVFLPQNYSGTAKVIFEYRTTLIEKISFLISFATLILLLISWKGIDWKRRMAGKLVVRR